MESLVVQAKDNALGFLFIGALMSYPPKLKRKVVMPKTGIDREGILLGLKRFIFGRL